MQNIDITILTKKTTKQQLRHAVARSKTDRQWCFRSTSRTDIISTLILQQIIV